MSDLSVSYKEIINQSAIRTWEVISTQGNLNLCHPFCKKNVARTWEGKGAEDSIEYYNGLVLKRSFTSWEPRKGYELLIFRDKDTIAKVLWEVKSLDKKSSELFILINMYPNIILKKYPNLLRKIIERIYLSPNMKHYVKSVVKGFKYYIETGYQVKKNQFGYNGMFSIK